jgi:hypothetical protein
MTLKDSANALQLLLKDFDFRKIDQEPKSPEVAAKMAADADVFYTMYFKNELNLMIQKQLEWVNANGTDEYAIQMGRGMVASLCLIREWFEGQVIESRAQKSEEKTKTTIDNVLQPLE